MPKSTYEAAFSEFSSDEDRPLEDTDPIEDEEEAVVDPEGEPENESEEEEEESEEESPEEEEEELDYKALYEKETQRRKSLEGRVNKQKEDYQTRLSEFEQLMKNVSQSKPKEENEADPDMEALNEFLEEFPEFQKPFELIAKKQAESIMQPMMQQARTLEEKIIEVERERHFNQIAASHSDWEEVVKGGEFFDWAKSKPQWLQQQIGYIAQAGNASQVIELLDLYKNETGQVENNQKPQGDRRRADAAAVRSRSGGPPKQKPKLDKNDYDGAFAAFAGVK